MQVSSWIQRTAERLKLKGATDVLCAIDGHGSFRRELTDEAGWTENRYKDRPEKDELLKDQLRLVHKLLEGLGFCCVAIDRYEADDVMASAAAQFPGKTTIITADKDLRQCLSKSCNMLTDVKWQEDEMSGELVPEYNWYAAAPSESKKRRNLYHDTGLWTLPNGKQKLGLSLARDDWDAILSSSNKAPVFVEDSGLSPSGWLSMQTLMGDSTDGIQGAEKIGVVIAAELIRKFGSVEDAIMAAKLGHASIREKQGESLIEFENRLEITRKLVTLRTDLDLPHNTRI